MHVSQGERGGGEGRGYGHCLKGYRGVVSV